MLLKIEKKGRRYIITNNPPFKYKKIEIQEIMELRKKYPELVALDQLTSDWMVNESDDVLLVDFYNERVKG